MMAVDGAMAVVRVDLEEHLASASAVATGDGRNGHVQAGWIIEHVTVGPNARPAPIAFAEDVRAALAAAVGGAPAFTNRR